MGIMSLFEKKDRVKSETTLIIVPGLMPKDLDRFAKALKSPGQDFMVANMQGVQVYTFKEGEFFKIINTTKKLDNALTEYIKKNWERFKDVRKEERKEA